MFIEGIGNAVAQKFPGQMNVLSVDINSAVTFVESYGVIEEDIPGNSMGLYTVAKNVRDGKVKFIQPTGDGYITKSRPAACAWDPVGGITYNKSEVSLCAHNVQIEHCTEDIPCWEGLFGQGNEVEDLLATEAGVRFYEDLVQIIYRAIGNDMAKAGWYGKHPMIASAKSSYTGDSSRWARIEKTLGICGGWLTLIDKLASTGKASLNVQINPDHISGDKYTGDPDALFRSLTSAMSPEFKAAVAQKKARGLMPVILVSGGIFERYQDWLSDRYVAIPESYYYKLDGTFCAQYGCVGGSMADDVLKWNGYWVKRMHIWDSVAADLEVYHHRAIITVPGNLGIGLDVQTINSAFDGVGLRVQQSMDLDKAGKLYAATNYRMGTAVIDDKFLVNASYLAV